MRPEKKRNRNKLLDIIRLRIYYASGKNYTLKFGYSDIKSEEIQEQLRNIHSARKNGNVKRIECLCKREKRALVHIKKTGNKYVIASNPNNKKKHSDYCLLGKHISEYVDIEGVEPKLKNFNIFTPPYFSSSNSKKSYDKRTPKEQEKTRRLTFGLLMGLILGEAYQFAFASENKIKDQKISRCSPLFPAKMPTNEKVIRKFYPKFKQLFHEKGNYSFKEFTKNYVLKVGIVKNFNYKKHNNYLEMEVICYLSPEDPEGKVLKLTIPRQRISNLILSKKAFSPSEPPLFIALIKDKNSHEITRAYVYPLLYSNKEKPFIPIDSKYEKSFINKIHNQGLKFIKPLKVNLTWHLFFTNLDIYKHVINHTYTPDLIIFKNSSIAFVEIIDEKMVLQSSYYRHNLENKRKSCNEIKNTIDQEVKNCHFLCLEARSPEELMSKLKTV